MAEKNKKSKVRKTYLIDKAVDYRLGLLNLKQNRESDKYISMSETANNLMRQSLERDLFEEF